MNITDSHFFKAITNLYSSADIDAFELFATLMHDLQEMDKNGTFTDAIQSVISGKDSMDYVLVHIDEMLDEWMSDDTTNIELLLICNEYKERIKHIYEVLGCGAEMFDY
jgi:hypothetical protein